MIDRAAIRVLDGDREIRIALRDHINATHGSAAVVLEELGLCRGDVRVDVAVVSDLLLGYEIKSDRDSLHRLGHQAEVYGAVLDRATLVVGKRHADDAASLVPAWWEILLASTTPEGVTLSQRRPGTDNQQRDRRDLVELLWLDDALNLLARRNAARGFRGKPRRDIWDRVCEVYSLDEIAAEVRHRLRVRSEHRSLRLLRMGSI